MAHALHCLLVEFAQATGGVRREIVEFGGELGDAPSVRSSIHIFAEKRAFVLRVENRSSGAVELLSATWNIDDGQVKRFGVVLHPADGSSNPAGGFSTLRCALRSSLIGRPVFKVEVGPEQDGTYKVRVGSPVVAARWAVRRGIADFEELRKVSFVKTEPLSATAEALQAFLRDFMAQPRPPVAQALYAFLGATRYPESMRACLALDYRTLDEGPELPPCMTTTRKSACPEPRVKSRRISV
mmetsp:Transcript_30936/g.67898  ORF Transcript_30936/g.67898 Transcript_30936/m.67898 type:complete len:241 (+) Transcript_30936:92-814(+)